MPDYIHKIIAFDDDGDAYRRRLDLLDITAEELEHAATAGFTRGGECTSNHPRIAPGFDTWSEMVAVLREIKRPQGWLKDSTRNYETIRHPDGVCAIAVSGGSSETGTRFAPHTRTSKGIVTAEVVERNFQLVLFGPSPGSDDGDKPIPTWLLLHYYDRQRREIRLELSLPLEMTNKKVTAWQERILLPPFAFDLGEDDLPDDDDDDLPEDEPIDVDVPRRPN